MNKEIEQVVRNVIREDPRVRQAFSAMRERGMSESEAEAEIGRAFLGCLWEVWKEMPDRSANVWSALAAGSSAVELFPDELYGAGGEPKA